MGQFKRRKDSDKESRSNTNRRNRKDSSSSSKRKVSEYKAKRSFSKNKTYRDSEKSSTEYPEKRREGDFKHAKPAFIGKRKSYDRKSDTNRKYVKKKSYSSTDEFSSENSVKKHKRQSFKRDSDADHKKYREGEKRFEKPTRGSKQERSDFSRGKDRKHSDSDGQKRFKYSEFEEGKGFVSHKHEKFSDKKRSTSRGATKPAVEGELIRLNKYLANAGVASRRDADNLILSGSVKVNGVVVDKLGTKIKVGDKVTYGDAAVKTERKVYLLLNKPKDYITTVDDPRERKTVMDLIKGACKERVYPVGRLDRNTTGLLLFTNDGELTTKLTHPKFGIKKVYHVTLNKGLKPEHFRDITEGIELEDGLIKADDLAFVGEGKKEIGIEIHSGRNRIVRRIFEHLGYDVIKLDRVVFAGLTKKDLPRGKHRFLSAKEIGFLQMIG